MLPGPIRETGDFGSGALTARPSNSRPVQRRNRMSKGTARDSIYRRRRFSPETIELCVRWYITYRLNYRDLSR